MQQTQFSLFSHTNTPKKGSLDISSLSNPEDETLFQLPSIAAKKHARKMLVNEVRSLGSGSNANLKAMIVIILKIAYGAQINKHIIAQLQSGIQNPQIKFSSISNNPNSNIEQTKLKSIFVDYLDILTKKYQEHNSNLQSHGKQILIENMLTQNPLLSQIMILYLRFYLCTQYVPNAEDFKSKVDTKIAYQIITQIFDINCRINNQYFIFYDDSLLIASHNGFQYVYGKYYQNEAEMRREQKLTTSTLQYLNMLTANRNNRTELLIQSKNSGMSQQNSDIVIFQSDQFGSPTPCFQRNEDFAFQNSNQKDKNDCIRIQINSPDKSQKKNNFIGQVITNIQMIESMNMPAQSTARKQPVSTCNQQTKKKQNKKRDLFFQCKNSNLSNSKHSQKGKIQAKQQYNGYTPITNGRGRKFLENKNFQNIQRHRSHRNQSFDMFQIPRKKTITQLIKDGRFLDTNECNQCICKQIAKTKNKMFSNLYSISINAQASPLRIKSPKSNKEFPGCFPKTKKQTTNSQLKEKKKQQNTHGNSQFNNIFRKKHTENMKGGQFMIQSPSSYKNYNFCSHPFLKRNHSNENVTEKLQKKIEKFDSNKKEFNIQDKKSFTNNNFFNKSFKLKNSPKNYQFKPANLKKSQNIGSKYEYSQQQPVLIVPHSKKMQSIQQEVKKPHFQFQSSPKYFKMPLKT